MNLAQVLSAYLNLNLLVFVGMLVLGLSSYLLKHCNFYFTARDELRLHYLVITCILILTAIHPLLPNNEFFEPAAKVWSAPSIKSFNADYRELNSGGYLSLPNALTVPNLAVSNMDIVWTFLLCALLLVGLGYIVRDLWFLFKIKKNSFLIRRLGRVQILVNDSIQVPYSYWLPGQANIIIPTSLLEQTSDYKMAVAHELQHHRHGDTHWVYILLVLKMICIFNPLIHLWIRWIGEIQEFACDEILIESQKVDSQAYARCLVGVAQTAIKQKYVPVCATGLTFLIEGNLLKRRIEKMLTQSATRITKSVSLTGSLTIGLLLASIMGATAYASKSVVQDRRVSLAQANAMAAKAQSEKDFPIVVNDLVLKQLNRYIGTPDGREKMRDSLQRMENFKSTVSEYLQKYQIPEEIMAIPLIESGYQNLTPDKNRNHKTAGLWQFIALTARNYGLRVDAQIDERLDVNLSTDAALRLLQADNLRFNYWLLSVLAYNAGEQTVQRGITTFNTKDAWTLIRKGYENDGDYLPRLMAAILIMRNPDSVK